jgi:hypothetical protein
MVVVHVARQRGEALLDIVQSLSLDANANFPQSEHKLRQFVSR